MILRNKRQEKRGEIKRTIVVRALGVFFNFHFSFVFLLLSFFFFLSPTTAVSQDSIPPAKDVSEEKELKFQELFFKALSEKSITNYRNAIVNLENCYAIFPGEIAVYSELSKNYYFLNKTYEAKYYIEKALEKDAENLWMLLHLIAIHKKDRNYIDAIKVQQKIIKNHPKRKEDLVYLHLQNKDYESAFSLIEILKGEDNMSGKLKRLIENLEKREQLIATKKTVSSSSNWIEVFENEKTFTALKKVLINALKENHQENILKYSTQGIALFPAQPLVYLMNGKALNYKKQYKKALIVLKDGVDFVIEDAMEADFYKEMVISYEKTGQLKEAEQYKARAKKLVIKQ